MVGEFKKRDDALTDARAGYLATFVVNTLLLTAVLLTQYRIAGFHMSTNVMAMVAIVLVINGGLLLNFALRYGVLRGQNNAVLSYGALAVIWVVVTAIQALIFWINGLSMLSEGIACGALVSMVLLTWLTVKTKHQTDI